MKSVNIGLIALIGLLSVVCSMGKAEAVLSASIGTTPNYLGIRLLG